MKRLAISTIIVLLMFHMSSCVLTRPIQELPFSKTIETSQHIGNSLIADPGDVSGLSIAILHEGALIYSEDFGKRDIGLDLPVDGETRFNIGSVSKVFTAASILLLQDDGLLNLDDRVSDILPGFEMEDQRYRDITVRMLLNHTSGMPGTHMRNGFSTLPSPTYLQETLQELDRSSLKHDPGAFSPYCNDGFTVAQAVIEQVSGMSFRQFLQQRIFDPMGMKQTSLGFYPEETDMAYAYADRSILLPKEFVNPVASGGLTSTAEDLCRFASITFGPSLLSAKALSEFLQEQKPVYLQDTDYQRIHSFGLGWDLTSWEPHRSQAIQVLGKSGGTLQYTAMLFVLPQTRSAVALVCSGHIDPIATTLPIIDALLQEIGPFSVHTKKKMVATKTAEPLLPGMEGYGGYYASDSAICKIDIDSKSSTMTISTHDGSAFIPTATSRHVGNGLFQSPDGTVFALQTLQGSPSLLEIVPTYNQADIKMTQLDIQEDSINHKFIPGFWLPTNVLPQELYLPLYRTDFIEELPPYLMVSGMSTIPYRIIDSTHTAMALPVVRDQAPPYLLEEGSLMIGPYRYLHSTAIPPLANEELLETDSENLSLWRRVTEHGALACTIPQGGRIVVLSPDFTTLVDTLYTPRQQLEIEVYGSYIAFIGIEGTRFEPTFRRFE